MEWRPIETAPKDGTDVLVIYPMLDKPDIVFIAHHDELSWDTGYWRLHRTPTHWMPLPEPPKES